MKFLPYALLAVLFTAPLAQGQTKPRSPGLQQGDQTQQQADRNIPLPTSQQPRVDFTKLHRDADELARLAQTIPLDVSSIQQGLLPKDMGEKLKQIERLSKRIRSQLNP